MLLSCRTHASKRILYCSVVFSAVFMVLGCALVSYTVHLCKPMDEDLKECAWIYTSQGVSPEEICTRQYRSKIILRFIVCATTIFTFILCLAGIVLFVVHAIRAIRKTTMELSLEEAENPSDLEENKHFEPPAYKTLGKHPPTYCQSIGERHEILPDTILGSPIHLSKLVHPRLSADQQS